MRFNRFGKDADCWSKKLGRGELGKVWVRIAFAVWLGMSNGDRGGIIGEDGSMVPNAVRPGIMGELGSPPLPKIVDDGISMGVKLAR